MRSNAAHYDMTAPASLDAALALLAAEPAVWTPLAGGTELMVALGAGRLAARKLLSLHRLSELRFIDVAAQAVTIGSATTFTDLRRHATVAAEFPLLAQAASWTGSIANQNRGTLGGNLVNASPAADSPPALLVYDAEVTLVSAAGSRTLPYGEFHLAYKKTALQPDELLFSVQLKRNRDGYIHSIRKVGTRNAQAISKVAIAGLARMHGASIGDVRLAAASLAETPIRLLEVERALLGRSLASEDLADAAGAARSALVARPIDDIRSTARYRQAVAANLVEAFLGVLSRSTWQSH